MMRDNVTILDAQLFEPCPACGAEDAIWLECQSDRDDCRRWTFAVVINVACGCDLTQAQLHAIGADCTETCNEPWEP